MTWLNDLTTFWYFLYFFSSFLYLIWGNYSCLYESSVTFRKTVTFIGKPHSGNKHFANPYISLMAAVIKWKKINRTFCSNKSCWLLSHRGEWTKASLVCCTTSRTVNCHTGQKYSLFPFISAFYWFLDTSSEVKGSYFSGIFNLGCWQNYNLLSRTISHLVNMLRWCSAVQYFSLLWIAVIHLYQISFRILLIVPIWVSEDFPILCSPIDI